MKRRSPDPSIAIATCVWRRLDRVGLDVRQLFETRDGWRLAGVSVFVDRAPCRFEYEVETDRDWISRRARVRGFIGEHELRVRIDAVGDGRWRLDGRIVPGVEGCIDLDLAVTPATNQIALRRLRLRSGQSADAPAACFDPTRLTLTTLPQTYRRLTRDTCDYASPTSGYRATLQVRSDGAVIDYPDVFELVEAR
jgi:hypothetical protein